MALRTVWSLQPIWWAMVVVVCPCALASSIWLRRTVKPCDDRRPASRASRSLSVSSRRKSGACIVLSFYHMPECLLWDCTSEEASYYSEEPRQPPLNKVLQRLAENEWGDALLFAE